ncbi:GMC family oxidoreductase [Mesorhizobium sp. INR15]|uniref:GMC family oxidoreductase n=1 Tax=Mesorhizobium sp. INR15 TaxID=2654248 RepID=UPI0027E51E3A|nr:GMC family oxidoreductase [Mesorhizobium sp. INR15]
MHLDMTPDQHGSAPEIEGQASRYIAARPTFTPIFSNAKLYLGKDVPVGGTAHQAGTLRFGENPTDSVLDRDCKVHGIDNLYVTDASFFPSIGAVNPTLTIIANALRVADRIV